MEIDEVNLKELDERLEEAEIARTAVSKAIDGHSVLKFVKTWPVENFPLYPALGNFTNPLITWNMPGRDYARASEKGCRINFSRNSSFVSCQSDRKHYARAKKFNCWSLTCPYCLNNKVLRVGDKVQHRIRAFHDLTLRQHGIDLEVKHWVISPPQKVAIEQVQRKNTFLELRNRVIDEILNAGMEAGVLVFHPWRQGSSYWMLGPHFHAVSYGYVDTSEFRRRNPDWVIKLVHADKAVRSVRLTLSYLLTHAGVGLVEKSDEDADLDARFHRMFFPDAEMRGKYQDTNINGDSFTVESFVPDRMDFLKGFCSLGPLYNIKTGLDWEQWVKESYTHTFQSYTYFGGTSRSRMRLVEIYKERQDRTCPVCETGMCIFCGMDDVHPEPAEINVELPVFAFVENVRRVGDLINSGRFRNVFTDGHFRELVESVPEAFIPSVNDGPPVVN